MQAGTYASFLSKGSMKALYTLLIPIGGFILGLMMCVLPTHAQFVKRATCYRTAGVIQVDGKLQEASWQFALPLGPFEETRSSAQSRYPTFARLLWDDSYLYVAFECTDPDIEVAKQKRDGVWNEDHVEIFVDPDGDGEDYARWRVTPLNTLVNELVAHRGTSFDFRDVFDRTWDPEGVQTAVQVNGTVQDQTDRDIGWTVEMAVPWSVFSSVAGSIQVPPEQDAVWRFGLYRNDQTDRASREMSAWSPSRDPTINIPERFGAVLFSEAVAAERPTLTLKAYRVQDTPAVSTRSGDGLPGPGEILKVEITVENRSEIPAQDVTALLQSQHPQAVVRDSVLRVDKIGPFEAVSTGTFGIAVRSGYVLQGPMPMRLHLEDRAGHKWTEGMDLYLDGISEEPFTLTLGDISREDGVRLTSWSYHSGDQMAWSRPEFREGDWETVRSLLSPGQFPKSGWTGVGWFRMRIAVDSTLWQHPLALKMAWQAGASEIYLDGRLLYTFGKVGETPAEEEAYLEHNPKVVLFDPGGVHLFAVRYSNASSDLFQEHSQPAGFSISLGHLNQSVTERVETAKSSIYLSTIFIGVPLIFTFLHLLLFLFYPRSKENLYYAIFTFSFAVLVFFNVQWLFFSTHTGDSLSYMRLFRVLSILPFIAVIRFAYALFYTALPRQFWIFCGLGLLLVGWDWVSPVASSWMILFMLGVFAEGLRVISIALVRKRQGAWIIGIGSMIFGLSFVYTSLVRFEILPAVTDAPMHYYGVLGLLGSMSVHLARNFGKTSTDLEIQLEQVKALSEQAIEQERRVREEEIQRKLLEEELQTAHDMQMGLMPKESPQVEGFDIAGRSIPASEVGGDFFQYFDHSGKLSLAMADVTGHAMAAAIPVVLFDGVLESQIHRGDPVKVLFRELNQTLHRILDNRTFVCFTLGELDPVTSTFRVSNGGCPYPYHFQASSGELAELQMDAYPLGVRPDTEYPEMETQLQPGDSVVFCSDGIIEAENPSGELFGYDRTMETIRQSCGERLSAEETIGRLLDVVNAFRGDVPQKDDMTCVVLRVETEAEAGG